jgi:hypothetical protein
VTRKNQHDQEEHQGKNSTRQRARQGKDLRRIQLEGTMSRTKVKLTRISRINQGEDWHICRDEGCEDCKVGTMIIKVTSRTKLMQHAKKTNKTRGEDPEFTKLINNLTWEITRSKEKGNCGEVYNDHEERHEGGE